MSGGGSPSGATVVVVTLWHNEVGVALSLANSDRRVGKALSSALSSVSDTGLGDTTAVGGTGFE